VKLFSALAGEYPTKGALLRHPAVAGISHLGEETKRACFAFRRRRRWPITDTYAGTFLLLWCSAPAELSDANPVLTAIPANPHLVILACGAENASERRQVRRLEAQTDYFRDVEVFPMLYTYTYTYTYHDLKFQVAQLLFDSNQKIKSL
jgi:hypothetical protein